MASLALENTSRTEEVSAAKTLVNTNDWQAHKPEGGGEYKSKNQEEQKQRPMLEIVHNKCLTNFEANCN